ncbi:MAG: hypothetical protein KJZ93_26335, partial [Caldilineaceae bacterium]|nr:hypothetical protein [Caldilineaceae bacterium]
DKGYQQMRAALTPVQKGYIHRVLFGGLHVLLERRDERWRLAIARIGTVPSQTEAATVARDFGLPAGIEWSYGQKPVKNVNVGRGRQPRLKYNLLECSWIEREPETERNPTL